MIDQFVDVPTAARYLGLGRQTVNNYILTKELPATRIGQRWLITQKDLQRLAARAPIPSGQRSPSAERGRLSVLAALAEHDGATVRELAESLDQPRRSVLEWAQFLDRQGLIERRRGNDPREPHHCSLTEAGRKAHRQAGSPRNLPLAGMAS